MSKDAVTAAVVECETRLGDVGKAKTLFNEMATIVYRGSWAADTGQRDRGCAPTVPRDGREEYYQDIKSYNLMIDLEMKMRTCQAKRLFKEIATEAYLPTRTYSAMIGSGRKAEESILRDNCLLRWRKWVSNVRLCRIIK